MNAKTFKGFMNLCGIAASDVARVSNLNSRQVYYWLNSSETRPPKLKPNDAVLLSLIAEEFQKRSAERTVDPATKIETMRPTTIKLCQDIVDIVAQSPLVKRTAVHIKGDDKLTVIVLADYFLKAIQKVKAVPVKERAQKLSFYFPAVMQAFKEAHDHESLLVGLNEYGKGNHFVHSLRKFFNLPRTVDEVSFSRISAESGDMTIAAAQLNDLLAMLEVIEKQVAKIRSVLTLRG